jgi:hypothetical protein
MIQNFNFIPGVIVVKPGKLVVYPFSANAEGRQVIDFPTLSKKQLEKFLESFADSTPEGVYQVLVLDKAFRLKLKDIHSFYKRCSFKAGKKEKFQFLGETEMHVDGLGAPRFLVVQTNLSQRFGVSRLRKSQFVQNGMNGFRRFSGAKPVNAVNWVFGSPVNRCILKPISARETTQEIPVKNGDILIRVMDTRFNNPHSVKRGENRTSFTLDHSGTIKRPGLIRPL